MVDALLEFQALVQAHGIFDIVYLRWTDQAHFLELTFIYSFALHLRLNLFYHQISFITKTFILNTLILLQRKLQALLLLFQPLFASSCCRNHRVSLLDVMTELGSETLVQLHQEVQLFGGVFAHDGHLTGRLAVLLLLLLVLQDLLKNLVGQLLVVV